MDYYINMYIITLYEQKYSILIFAFPPHYQVVSISIRLSLFSRVRCKLIKHLSETSQAYSERQETKYSDKRIRSYPLKYAATTPYYHDLITQNKPCQRNPTSQSCTKNNSIQDVRWQGYVLKSITLRKEILKGKALEVGYSNSITQYPPVPSIVLTETLFLSNSNT